MDSFSAVEAAGIGAYQRITGIPLNVEVEKTRSGGWNVWGTIEGDERPSVIRVVHADGLSMDNVLVALPKPLRGQGLGTKIFAAQVGAAKACGVLRFYADAAGSARDTSRYNGFYTWAVLGYDGWTYVRRTPRGLSGKRRVSEILNVEGADWWLSNGEKFDGEFDLRAGSYSMRTLERYLAARS